MARRFKDIVEEYLPDRLPIDVMPFSNGEFVPPEPTREQIAIMKLAREACEEAARRHGMSRRRFLQTGAAYGICLWAINKVMGGGYALAEHPDECSLHAPLGRKKLGPNDIPLEYPGAQMINLPGEFIMDLQTHHVDSGGQWRARNPGEEAFFAAVFGGRQCKSIEIDPIECIGRFHYLKELFLDSSTNLCVLSAVPYQPDGQPLPIDKSDETARMVNELAGTRRSVIHKFVMPNRGSMGTTSDGLEVEPLFLKEELDMMTAAAEAFGKPGTSRSLRAWKVYTPWGDVPYSSGWWLDDPSGRRFIEHAQSLSATYDMPALICAHKGFALPSFEQTKAATRDVGIVAKAYPGVDFIIYHTGYDGDSVGIGGPFNQGTSASGEYPGPGAAPSINRGADNFITSLIENGWSARHVALGKLGTPGLLEGELLAGGHANVPNVYAELGSVWASVSNNPLRAAYLMTKLVWYVGPRRIVWGTDCLWTGSPQPQIATLRAFNMRDETGVPDNIRALARKYRMPYGLDGHVDNPEIDAKGTAQSIRNGILGRNAAVPYRITEAEIAAATDPSAAIACSDAQKIRDGYLINPLTPASPLASIRDEYRQNPMASHEIHGPRTRRELFAMLREDPWHRGARKMQNDRGFLKKIG